MTKAELIDELASKMRITHVRAELVVNTVFESIIEALSEGDRVEIRNFGTFEMRHYDAYEGRNPKTGQVIHVPRKRAPFFKAGKNIKKKLIERLTRS